MLCDFAVGQCWQQFERWTLLFRCRTSIGRVGFTRVVQRTLDRSLGSGEQQFSNCLMQAHMHTHAYTCLFLSCFTCEPCLICVSTCFYVHAMFSYVSVLSALILYHHPHHHSSFIIVTIIITTTIICIIIIIIIIINNNCTVIMTCACIFPWSVCLCPCCICQCPCSFQAWSALSCLYVHLGCVVLLFSLYLFM